MAKVNIYLTFDGTCEAAFNFYKTVFGSEFGALMRYKDMPAGDFPVPDSIKEQVMHVNLPINDDVVLYGSDSFDAACGGAPLVVGNNVAISLNTATEEESHRLFDALAAGGNIRMPLGPTFWTPLYGLVSDQYGIEWMVNYEPQQA